MRVDTVIYHDSCADGWCAAWLFARAYPGVALVPAQYGQAPPDVAGKDVVVVDFSYKRPVMLDLIDRARSLVVLDHHKTAEAELVGLAGCTFDVTKSGGRLAWEWLWDAKYGRQPPPVVFPGGENVDRNRPPMLVRIVESRDLWRFDVPYTREVMAAVSLYPRELTVWDRLAEVVANGAA